MAAAGAGRHGLEGPQTAGGLRESHRRRWVRPRNRTHLPTIAAAKADLFFLGSVARQV